MDAKRAGVVADPADPNYLKACVDIFPEVLDEEFVRVPADIAYWSGQFASAARDRDYAELLLKQVRATAENRIRLAAQDTVERLEESLERSVAAVGTEKVTPAIASKGPKAKSPATRLTESAVAAAVALDSEVMEAEKGAIEADYQVNRLKGIVDAVRCKKDMIIQIGANHRLEMEGDPLLRQRFAQRREARGA